MDHIDYDKEITREQFRKHDPLKNKGDAVYDRIKKLFLKYNCNIVDCYEKPQYLNDVSRQVFGKTYFQIIESIKNNLDEFADVKQINKFLKIMNN